MGNASKETRKERQERKQAEFNDVRLKLIYFREIFEKEEQHLDEIFQEFERYSGEMSAVKLTEQESWTLFTTCSWAVSDLKDCKCNYERVIGILKQLIDRYDERRKTYTEWVAPPLFIPKEFEEIQKMLEGDKTSDSK